jgi:copper resistance protein C
VVTRIHRLAGNLCGLLALAGLLAIASAGPAAAHAVLESTSPAAGATLAAPPKSVSLTFDEAPQQEFSTVHVTGPDGQRKDSGTLANHGAVLEAQLVGSTPAGRYVVDWRVVSDDGHPISGQFAFSVSRNTQLGASPSAVNSFAPASSSPSAVAAPASKGGGGSNPGLIAGIVAAVVLIVGNIGWLTSRRRRSAVHE